MTQVRPMGVDDVAAAEAISADAFLDVDRRRSRRDAPEPVRRAPERSARWIARTAGMLTTDSAGCWVAEDETGVVGFATSIRRERMWALATFAVRPGLQGRGIGARLLERAEEHGRGCDVALLAASDDPMALRRYWRAGFALHPQYFLTGEVRPGRAAEGVRVGTAADRPWMDDLDRRRRGGPHGADHAALSAMIDPAELLVDDDGAGYAYASSTETFLIAADDDTTAARLLRACLARAEGAFTVPHVTAANPWALDVAMEAGLSLSTSGFLGVRGMAPPTPYLHNGALL